MIDSHTASSPSVSFRHRFVSNVLWNWLSVAVPLVAGLALSPYIIRKLGAEGYGLWSLVFSMIGYYGLLDFGFRSAVVRFTAHFHARGEHEKINQLVNTALAYFSAVCLLLLCATVYLSRNADRFFRVSVKYRDDFLSLVLLVGVSVSLGVIWNVFTGCVEGFQRFDLSSRISILAMTLRTAGVAVLLALGHGLVEMGAWALATQLLLFVLYYVNLRRIFPALRFSFSLVRVSLLREIASYGFHTMVATFGSMTLDQGTPVVIGHLRPAAEVGYYSLPLRLLQYAADMVGRAGLVLAPRAAELGSTGRLGEVPRLAIVVNRYCLALFMPLFLVLMIFGRPLMELWVGVAFAAHSAPLLPVFLIGTTFAVAAQFSSGTVLFGLGKHQTYARTLFLEGILVIGASFILVPRQGIIAAACVASCLMFLNRGLLTPLLLCRILGYPLLTYMRSILLAPTLTAIPYLLFMFWLKKSCPFILHWTYLVPLCVGFSAAYLVTASFTCLEREHRPLLAKFAGGVFDELAGRGRRLCGVRRKPDEREPL